MLERTLKTIKEANPQGLYDVIMEYCATSGFGIPKNVETRIMLAMRLGEEGLPEGEQMTISELQEIEDFVDRAVALKEKKRRLLTFKNFIEETVGSIDMGDLALRGKELLSHFSPGLMLVSSFSPEVLDDRCNSFVEDYRIAYVNYHNTWHSRRSEIGDRYSLLIDKADTLKKLNTIEEFDPKLGVEPIATIDKFPREMPFCRVLTVSDLGFSTACPYCGLKYKRGMDWHAFEKIEKELDMLLRKKLRVVSSKVANIAIEKYADDPLLAFIDAVVVSDLKGLSIIMSDEVLETLKRVLRIPKG